MKTTAADFRKIQYTTVTVIKSFQLVLIHLNSLLVMIVCYRNCKHFHALREFFLYSDWQEQNTISVMGLSDSQIQPCIFFTQWGLMLFLFVFKEIL